MSETRNFLVPEYYSQFSCKCGDCNSTCCSTWSIPISLDEYLKMLSIPCSNTLRKQLDHAFHIADTPTPERYAVIAPRYDGTCPLLMESGLCLLQHECGFEKLSNICRCYPRGARKIGNQYEAACANSCERTLELLLDLHKPMKFIHQPLPEDSLIAIEHDEAQDEYIPLRKLVFEVMEDRSEPLPARLMRLGRIVSSTEDNELTKNAKQMLLPEKDISFALKIQYDLISLLAQTSISFSGQADAILAALDEHSSCVAQATKQYEACVAHLYETMPGIDVYFEQLLVNHMFFETFPFNDKQETTWHAYMSLCATYAAIKIIAAYGMMGKHGLDDYIGLMAHAFRAIEHSSFDHNALVILMRNNCSSQSLLDKLLMA